MPVWPAGAHTLVIEVVGSNCNSYAVLNQPSFLKAELLVAGNVVAATGGESGGDFDVLLRHDRVQQVQRYSFQRPAR
jgi:hypothetical protein